MTDKEKKRKDRRQKLSDQLIIMFDFFFFNKDQETCLAMESA